jgi:hypothetical protein
MRQSASTTACAGLTRLAKRDNDRLGIRAAPALESPLVIIGLLISGHSRNAAGLSARSLCLNDIVRKSIGSQALMTPLQGLPSMAALQIELQRIDEAVSRIHFPLAFSDQVYNLRSHIEIVRRRTAPRENLPIAAE